jgi:hypothetical protein
MNADTPVPFCEQDNNDMRTREEEVEKYDHAAMATVAMANNKGDRERDKNRDRQTDKESFSLMKEWQSSVFRES